MTIPAASGSRTPDRREGAVIEATAPSRPWRGARLPSSRVMLSLRMRQCCSAAPSFASGRLPTHSANPTSERRHSFAASSSALSRAAEAARSPSAHTSGPKGPSPEPWLTVFASLRGAYPTSSTNQPHRHRHPHQRERRSSNPRANGSNLSREAGRERLHRLSHSPEVLLPRNANAHDLPNAECWWAKPEV
jgi:hypothetical protein